MLRKNDLKDRTKRFAISIIDMVDLLSNSISQRTISNQLIKCATSVGANYRAACRARSDKEFISKMSIVLEETDETCYWLEIIQEKKWLSEEILNSTLKEANELTAIFVSSLKTIKSKQIQQNLK